MTSKTANLDRTLGMLYGLARGDALGAPVEFLSRGEIRVRFGPGGIKDLPAPALFTDDAQMTLAVAKTLAATGDQDLEVIMAGAGQ